MHPVLSLIALCAGLAALSWMFGTVLKLSDLLQEHGYRWFRGADLVAGAFCAVVGVGILVIAEPALRMMWLAVLVPWIGRGRIDGLNHGLTIGSMLLYLLIAGPAVTELPWVFAYFVATLGTLGVVHDVLQYTRVRAPRPIEWFFENQHLYWYLTGAGYLLLFEPDLPLFVALVGFVKGYGFLYRERNRRWAARFGIRAPAEGEQGQAESVGSERSGTGEAHPS